MITAPREVRPIDEVLEVIVSMPDWGWMALAIFVLTVVMIQVAAKRLTREEFRDHEEHTP